MRQVLSTAITAVVVSLFTLTVAGAMAQSERERTVVTPAAGINADTVDGKHAVGYTTKKAVRRGKLVATNARGMLPPNIVRPFWGAIQNMPPGFADGVDDGITGLKVTRVVGALGAGFTAGQFGLSPAATCPSGSVLVGGGAAVSGQVGETSLLQSYPWTATGWYALAYKEAGSSGTAQLQTYALCLSVESGGPITSERTGKAAKTRTVTR